MDLLPLIVLAALALVALVLVSGLSRALRKKRGSTPRPKDGDSSLDALAQCKLALLPLLNKEERGLHARLENFIASEPRCHGMRLFAQVALDEIFGISEAPDKKLRFSAHAAFRQKRVDFLIVDADMRPLCGVEYQGSGHHQGNSAQRDRVKAKAFEVATLPLVIIEHREAWPQVIAELRAALRLPNPAIPQAEIRQTA